MRSGSPCIRWKVFHVGYLVSLVDGWPRFRIYRFGEGHYRWVLLTASDQVLARSAGPYGSEEECLRAVDTVRRAIERAKVDTTLLHRGNEEGAVSLEPKA